MSNLESYCKYKRTLPLLLCQPESPRMDRQRFSHMLRHKLPVVLSRIDMDFMSNMVFSQQLVQLSRAAVKAKVIMVAAIHVDFQAIPFCRPRKNKRGVCLPELLVHG